MADTHTDIDWDTCTRNLITADCDHLPSNIRSLKADHLDCDTLRTAYNLLGSEVNAVQIEVPPVTELIGFPHEYITQNRPFYIEIEPYRVSENIMRTSYEDLRSVLRQKFGTHIENTQDERHKILLEKWQQCIAYMPTAAEDIWPQGYKSLWIYGTPHNSQTEKQEFYSRSPYINEHNQKIPGFLLNYCASHDGMMFPGNDGNLWFGKGGGYMLFPTTGHAYVEGARYKVPDQFQSPIENETCATAVLQVYPTADL